GSTVVQDGGIGSQLNVATPGPSGASQYTRKAWFGFDLTALKAAVGNNGICSASITFQLSTNVEASFNGNNSMRFYGVTNVNPGSIDGSATGPVFDETALTWANAPGNIDGDVLAGDKINGSILADVPIPSPAANGVMVVSGLQLANLIKTGIAGTNHFVTVAATYLGQNNNGFSPNAAGFQTGLSFISKEGGTGKAILSVEHQSTPCAMVIVSQPQGGCFYPGATVNLTVDVVGAPPLSYQWTRNGVTVSGATGSTLSLTNLGAGGAGDYQAFITNPTGTTNSTVVSVSLLSAPAIANGFEQTTGTNTPIGYWRFNETAPVTQDIATNRGSLGTIGDGLYKGLVSHQQTGALIGSSDKATAFNGQYLAIPYAAENNTATFTAEAWLKPAVTNAAGTLTSPLSSVHIGSPRAGWLIYQSDTGWNFRTYNENGTTTAVSITGGPVPIPGQWYHVAVSWDGTVGRVYVNGVLAATSAATTYVANADGAFSVGSRNDGAFLWNGVADEVAVYGTNLTGSQILAHYTNGTNAAPATPYNTLVTADGPTEYFRLNENNSVVVSPNRGTRCASADATYVPDSASVGTIGINTGNAGPQPPAQLGFESGNKAVGLTGSYAQVPALNLNKNTATIAGWIKRNGPQASFSGVVFSRANGTVAGLHFGTADELRYTWAGSGSTYDWDSGLIPPDGVWTFVALVIEPTQATMYMYDGTALRSAVNSVNHPVQGFQGPTVIGRDPTSSARSFIGDLDEIAIYDKALSAAQIALLAGSAQFGTTAPSITKPVVSQTIFEGDSATFTVTAAGSLPLSYRWFSNGVPTSATGASYTVSNAT
ncbi:MAG: LamG-like jellyroll fold domain-containing protein, partial [Verrucomicrobiota bacterium]